MHKTRREPWWRSARIAALPGLCALMFVSPSPTLSASEGKPSTAKDVPAPKPLTVEEVRGRKLLDESKARMKGVNALLVDYQRNNDAKTYFDRDGQITLARPGKFSVVEIKGMVAQRARQLAVSDGIAVTRMQDRDFIAYRKPLHQEDFFLGHNFLVQFFFDPRPIAFDPTDSTWGQSVSLFDKNKEAYDKNVSVRHLGARTLQGQRYEVIGIRYNTSAVDIRQQIYVGDDRLVYQVDTSFKGRLFSEKFRNYKLDPAIDPKTFQVQKPEKMPFIESDPIRLGKPAPDFTLPGYNGEELTLKNLLKGRKGLFIAVLDGTEGRKVRSADALLLAMRTIQLIKDRFEKQGLGVVCILGSPELTPDLVSEMKLNWLPDVSRFNYPFAIDVDVERGIQGSAYESFRLNGRNSVLLDGQGRTVFASYDFGAVNLQAFSHALAQIGFMISPADIEAMM